MASGYKVEDYRLRPVRYAPDVVVSTCGGCEDVLLWRVLHETRNGFFVDVGAGDPNWGSPTRWFSANGWSGINIEPHPLMFSILSQWRPNDINLNCGVSEEEGVLSFYRINPTETGVAWGLSSFSKESADEASRRGYLVAEEFVSTRRLGNILHTYAKDRTIDLLKIDVEGYEESVINLWTLAGIDLAFFVSERLLPALQSQVLQTGRVL